MRGHRGSLVNQCLRRKRLVDLEIIMPSSLGSLCSLAAVASVLSQSARAQTISEHDAHDIGVNAYLYFYSPITMDLTRKQPTNVEPGKGLGGPMNSFANVAAYPMAVSG